MFLNVGEYSLILCGVWCFCINLVSVCGGQRWLSRKHGVKVGAGSVLSMEEVALAVGQKTGHSSIKSTARINEVYPYTPYMYTSTLKDVLVLHFTQDICKMYL